MDTIYLSLGSNVGDRVANLNTAIAELPQAGVYITQVSSIYETEPVDYLQQDWFLNSVVRGETEIEPLELLSRLRDLETEMGSKKLFAKGPRLIDIDILLYGDRTIATELLDVPHPRMTQRRFVLVPLVEIAPGIRHPSWHSTATELLRDTSDKSRTKRIDSG